MFYDVKYIDTLRGEPTPLTDEIWDTAEKAELLNTRYPGEVVFPSVTARALYDDKGIYVRFDVKNDHVRCVETEYQSGVCCDSCAEFFVWPAGCSSYANIEVNACGVMLVYQVLDWRRAGASLGKLKPFPPEGDKEIRRWTTFHGTVFPEPAETKDWTNVEFVPFSLLKKIFGADAPKKGDEWKANFFKCGDHTSNPHWLSWNPLLENNFHTPDCFGTLIFQ